MVGGRGPGLRGEDDVAALDVGGDLDVAQPLDDLAEVGHREPISATDVDAARERDERSQWGVAIRHRQYGTRSGLASQASKTATASVRSSWVVRSERSATGNGSCS